MARHVTIRRTKVTTEDLRSPAIYRLQGAALALGGLAAGLLVWGALAWLNCC